LPFPSSQVSVAVWSGSTFSFQSWNSSLPGPAMMSRFYVALNEPGTVRRGPVLATLAHLAEAASLAIKLFDT
jgi:hypothetical protein